MCLRSSYLNDRSKPADSKGGAGNRGPNMGVGSPQSATGKPMTWLTKVAISEFFFAISSNRNARRFLSSQPSDNTGHNRSSELFVY